MTSTQHLEMEIDLIEKKKTAIESDLRYKGHQYNNNIPSEPGLEDQDTAFAILMSLVRDRDRFDVEIAEKRLELYSLQAGEVATFATETDVPPTQPTEPENPTRKKVDRVWYYVPQEKGRGQFLALER